MDINKLSITALNASSCKEGTKNEPLGALTMTGHR